jgi:hypothetical protein
LKIETFPTIIVNILNKYPELESKFKELSIVSVSDIQKLANRPIEIPTINNINDLPSETVIAQSGNGTVPVVSSIVLANSGIIEQRLKTTVGSDIKFAIKPISKVKSVIGKIVLKRSLIDTAIELPVSEQTASVFLSFKKAFGQETNELVLKTFAYTDNDNDGIYTADVALPETEGVYDVKTTIDYEDSKLGKKEVNIVAVVDEEGYVYEKIKGKEARLPDVTISIMDAITNTLWNAKKYNQINPQITNETGKYAFILPKGKYYITAEHKDYEKYTSKTFEVKNSTGVYERISMQEKKWVFGRLFKSFLSIFGIK